MNPWKSSTGRHHQGFLSTEYITNRKPNANRTSDIACTCPILRRIRPATRKIYYPLLSSTMWIEVIQIRTQHCLQWLTYSLYVSHLPLMSYVNSSPFSVTGTTYMWPSLLKKLHFWVTICVNKYHPVTNSPYNNEDYKQN